MPGIKILLVEDDWIIAKEISYSLQDLGFEIAGSDQQFHYAKAMIKGDYVVVSCEEVPSPVAVRFGWTDDAGEDNLFNKDGFPASPFRTDNWKGITEENKFSF